MTNITVFVSTPPPLGCGAHTDANGFFRLEGLDSLGSERFPIKFNYKITLPDVALNTTNLTLVWPDSGIIEGRVFDVATGSNLAAFSVSVTQVRLAGSPAVYEKPSVQFERQDDGRFRMANVPAGRATLVVSNATLGVCRFIVDVPPGQTVEIECPMAGAAILEGNITLNGKPHHASVVINGEWVSAGIDGRYRFQNQPPGKHVVWFFDHEYSHRYADVELIAGQTVKLDMELAGPCSLSGTVHFPADGPNHGELRLSEIPPAGAWGGGRPEPAERVLAIAPVEASEPDYELKALPSGRFHLTTGLQEGFQYRPVWTREIELKAGESLVLDVDLSAIAT